MKKNRLFLLSLLVMVFAFCLYSHNEEFIAAEGYDPLTNANGDIVKYYGSNTSIQIPTYYKEKKKEFRGTWVSFYAGDISAYTSKVQMQNQLLNVLDTLEYYHMNSIVFHVRTHNDALYDTNLAPRSSYLGNLDFEEWDYLEWFITECHKRGIEFHAWLNPYRIMTSGATATAITEKYKGFNENPASNMNNVLIANNATAAAILNPAVPEVRDYITNVCMELIRKYDIDAIHFDDYFYIGDVDDSAQRKLYNKTNMSVDNFRREQVNLFIKQLSTMIRKYNDANNKCVQLGISPTGIYNNGSYVSPSLYSYDSEGTLVYPTYSGTAGYAHYPYALYADTKKWIDNEWIDYICPQAYHALDQVIASHAALADWWNGVVKNKKVNLYMGLGLYKTSESASYGWTNNENELLEQLRYDQDKENIDGICIYQYRSLTAYRYNNALKTLVSDYWTKTPVNPEVEYYKDTFEFEGKVNNLKLYKENNCVSLSWDKLTDCDQYVIYRYTDSLNINDPVQLIGVTGNTEKEFACYTDETYNNTTLYYAVLPVSRANTVGKETVISTQNSTKLEYQIGVVDATVSPVENINGYVIIRFQQPYIYFGGECTYTILCSYNADFSDRIVVKQDLEVTSSNSYRFKFDDKGRNTYIKVVFTNNMGTFETEIMMVGITDDAMSIIDYIYNRSDELFENILNSSNE